MKFNCDAKEDRRKQWHLHFAWFPVRVKHGDCRWLESVWRRGTLIGGFDPFWIWEYKPCDTPHDTPNG